MITADYAVTAVITVTASWHLSAQVDMLCSTPWGYWIAFSFLLIKNVWGWGATIAGGAQGRLLALYSEHSWHCSERHV